jgi:hypothetical protein
MNTMCYHRFCYECCVLYHAVAAGTQRADVESAEAVVIDWYIGLLVLRLGELTPAPAASTALARVRRSEILRLSLARCQTGRSWRTGSFVGPNQLNSTACFPNVSCWQCCSAAVA